MPSLKKADAAGIVEATGKKAQELANQAHTAVSEGIEWATPKIQEVAEKLAPSVEEARQQAEAAAEKLKPALHEAREKALDTKEKVVNDYIPRAKAAAEAASAALVEAEGNVAEKLQAAGEKALAASKPKKRRFRTFLKITAALAALGGIAYVLWNRSRPTEDPWAEAYWEDHDSDTCEDCNPEAKAEEPEATEDSEPSEGEETEEK